jgi:predicted nicotinamide N-methyase
VSSPPSTSISESLTTCLQRALAAARAERTRLPDVPELELYLLNADFSNAGLTPDEMRAVLEYPAYWAFCWASGQALARHLLDHPQLVAGQTVLDFGSGSGVAAIAACKAGAARVIACDLDPDARLATRINAALNGVAVELAADFEQVDAPVDLVLAADVLYDRSNIGWLPRFLARAPRALVADSRVKNFSAAGYRPLGYRTSSTWPDLDEFDDFRRVNLYLGERGERR